MTERYKKFKEDLASRKVTFFLFGQTAIDLLESEGKTPKQITKKLGWGDYTVFAYTEGYNCPNDLLAEYDGWMNYMEITPEQYYEFLINEKK